MALIAQNASFGWTGPCEIPSEGTKAVSQKDKTVNPIIFFDSEDTARTLIAGLPCAVRALQRIDDGSTTKVSFVSASGWSRPDPIEAETRRLFPSVSIDFLAIDEAGNGNGIDALTMVSGDLEASPRSLAELGAQSAGRSRGETQQILKRASREIIGQTGKPTDGFVSRYLNRPISQFVSYHLLKLAWIRPIHATILAGVIGIIMALCLFLGGQTGLIAGGILFQFASIIDGVDGEIARATHRSSKSGATLDTATDAATNFAFLAGIIANQWQSGAVLIAQTGLAAIVLLAIGLALLGLVSLRQSGALSFDVLKHDPRTTSSGVMSALAKLLSRDVYVLLLSLLCVVGLVKFAIALFVGVVAIWFVVAVFMLITRQQGQPD